jgi:hypothetical protein
MDRDRVFAALITSRWAELQRLEKMLAGRQELTSTIRGTEKPDPLLAEIRSHTWLLRALLDSAGHPAGEPPAAADALDQLRAEFEDGINA